MSTQPPAPEPPKRALGQHPLLGWRGLLLVLVVLFIGVPFFRGLTGTDSSSSSEPATRPPSNTTAPARATRTPAPDRPTATPRPAPATPTIGPAAEPADSLDEFRAAELCSAAVLNQVNPDAPPDYNIAEVFADQQTQQMRVWNTMEYSSGGQQRSINYECRVQMQDDWARGTVIDVQIAEASP